MQGMIGTNVKGGQGTPYLDLLDRWARNLDYPGSVHESAQHVEPFAAQVYDAVLAFASAIDKVPASTTVDGTSITSQLRGFTGGEKYFLGATGRVFFDAAQDGPPAYALLNLVGSRWAVVGSWTAVGRVQFTEDILWPGGQLATPSAEQNIIKSDAVIFNIGHMGPTDEGLGGLGTLGRELEAAFRVAIKQVNDDDSLSVHLVGYTGDTGLSTDFATTEAHALLDQGVVAVVGALRSSSSMAIAPVFAAAKVPQISAGSTSSALSDKARFPYFFRIVCNDDHQGQALADMTSYFSWTRVALIYTDDAYAKGLADSFVANCEQRNIEIVAKQELSFPTFNENAAAEAVSAARKGGSAITVVVAITDHTEVILQELATHGMSGRGWMTLGSDGATSTSFSGKDELRVAMRGMLGTQLQSAKNSLLFDLFLAKWAEKDPATYPGLVHDGDQENPSAYVAQTHDAVYVVAKALHQLVKQNKHTDTANLGPNIKTELMKLKDAPLAGVLGPIYFDENQDGPVNYDMLNLEGSKWEVRGTYEAANGLVVDDDNIFWPGGVSKVPLDAPPVQTTWTVDTCHFTPQHTDLPFTPHTGW